jgi:hypothetical protein
MSPSQTKNENIELISYEVLFSTWFQTKLQLLGHIIALDTAGLGFLALHYDKIGSNPYLYIFWIAACVGFIASICFGVLFLVVGRKNIKDVIDRITDVNNNPSCPKVTKEELLNNKTKLHQVLSIDIYNFLFYFLFILSITLSFVFFVGSVEFTHW